MENKTSFNLDHSIGNWRECLASSPSFQNENLNELESHLRDSVATLETRGLSSEESFLIATRRMGQSHLLENEFGKLNRQSIWLDRIIWMLLGWQVWSLIFGVTNSLSRGALFLGLIGADFDLYAHGQTISLIGFTLVQLIALVASLAFCWWLFVRKGQSLIQKIEKFSQRRIHLFLTCLAVVLLFPALNHLIHFGVEMLFVKHLLVTHFGQVRLSMVYSTLLIHGIQGAVFFALTVVLFRKRLAGPKHAQA